MERVLAERECAWLSLPGAAAWGHRPARFAGAVLGDAGLARRLGLTAALPGHSGAVDALAWTEGGDLLASGGEDCRLRLWRGGGAGAAGWDLLHSLDTGHTATILSAAFLPGSHGDQLLCCSADRQIRHIAVTKGAVRPYLVHSGHVRAVVPLDPYLFLSASEDGTVREFDVRQRPAAVRRDALAGDDSNVLVDQRAERVGRARVRVGVLSLAVDPLRPWLMLTGGTDPLLRLYDRRMLPAGEAPGEAPQPGGRGRAPQWVSAYAPSHIKTALCDSGRHPGLENGGAGGAPGRHVTGVAFARGGAELVGSYCGECIYSFDVAAHARDVDALLHIPETVLRAPARPRSHARRRSMHGTASVQEPAGLSPPAVGTLAATATAAAAAAEGAGGTASEAGRLRQQQQQQRQRAAAGRGLRVASSVRLLERQRRAQSRAAAGADPPRAESSRPAHWQMRPTSSTLRSPLNEVRQGQHTGAAAHAAQHAPPPARPRSPPAQQHSQQHDSRLHSESEGASDVVSPEGHALPRQGVRRSRRIMRRRREEAEAAEQHEDATAEAAEAEAEAAQQQQHLEQQQEVQQTAVSGVAEPTPASGSDSEDAALHSPTTRRRVRRRVMSASAGDEHAGAAGQQQQQQQQQQLLEGAGAAAGGSGAAAVAAAAGDGFKAPPGRTPQHRHPQAAAAAAAMQRLDSTVGLLHHHGPQLEASEVAAGQPHAQQEATVSMRHPHAAAAANGPPERSPAVEVTSRPVLSASQAGLATQLGSQQAGHEASSLNSAKQPAREHVGSVMQKVRADAPSVGNAPLATTAAVPGAAGAAAAAAGEQQEVAQGGVEVGEASTGHRRGGRASGVRLLPPPPQFGGTRQRQLQPTASTGTSRPPAFGTLQQQQQQQRYLPPAASGRQGSRLRRHSEVLEASQQAEAAAAGGSQAVPEAGAADGLPLVADGQPAGAWAPSVAGHNTHSLQQHGTLQQQQQQPQATMLSGRGPSVLGDFMPGQQEQRADSEIQQRGGNAGLRAAQGSVGAEAGPAAGAAGSEEAGEEAPGRRRHQRRRQVDSHVGAIVHNADGDDGEEVSEPTMFRRRYAGHLNLSPARPHDGPPAAPQLAFLGLHSELLVSPSDCGSLFVWDYASGQLVAVLPPGSPAAAAMSSGAASGGSAQQPAAPCTCVAPHPLLPVLASGGGDSMVRLWSPEAAAAGSQEAATAAVRANLAALEDAGGRGGAGALGAGAGALDAAALLRPGSPCTFM